MTGTWERRQLEEAGGDLGGRRRLGRLVGEVAAEPHPRSSSAPPHSFEVSQKVQPAREQKGRRKCEHQSWT